MQYYTGKPKEILTPEQIAERQKLARKRAQEKLRLKQNEAKANTLAGSLLLTVRTQSEVAQIMGITRARVQQIEREALHKLRVALKDYNPFV